MRRKGRDIIKKVRKFFINAALLSVVSIVVRAVSVSFNAYVAQKIGTEAMGLFTLVMSVYGLFVTLAAAGVNLAAVKLTAEELVSARPKLKAVMRACCLYSALFGAASGIVLFFSSPFIGRVLLDDVRTVLSLRALSFALVPISVSSALAGYFTGVRKVYKNAATTVAECAAKILFTTAALVVIAPAGLEYACLAVVGGSALAEGLSLAASFLFYIFDKAKKSGKIGGKASEKAALKADMKRTAAVAFPVAVGSYFRQALLTAEHIAIPWGLKKSGKSSSDALSSYGVLHGMVFPLLLFPSAVLNSFASLLVPELAECAAVGDMDKARYIARRVIRTSLLFAVGVGVIFASFPYEIAAVLYNNTEAGRQLCRLAFLVPVMYLDTAVDAMLKGLGQQVYSMKVNIIDASLSLILVLIAVPRLGIDGYILVIITAEIVNASLSISRLISVIKLKFRYFSWIFVPYIAAFFAAGGVKLMMCHPAAQTGFLGGEAQQIALSSLLYLLIVGIIFIKKKKDI